MFSTPSGTSMKTSKMQVHGKANTSFRVFKKKTRKETVRDQQA